jgi:ABC-type multidrug transport system fused ATPase/permease subunit
MGALYLAAPALEAALVALYCWRLYAVWQGPGYRPDPVPAGVWVWIAGMGGMLMALLIAHLDWGLGVGQTVKSTVGWVKGWALLAAFPLAGACLRIRPEIVVRAAMWMAVQTLCLIPILFLAALAHLPSKLFTSPLQAIGGPGPEFFSVYLYTIDPENGASRWQFIAPWSPAAGMIGDMILVLASFERDRRLRILATISAVLICLMTKSRMAILFLAIYPPLIFTVSRLSRPALLAASAALSVLTGIVANKILQIIQDSVAAFKGVRASSSRVREALGQLAVQRWREEAPIFGHGIVQRGDHYVEFMPIGSHHTWFGLLYVKGVVGVVSLALPLLWAFVEMLLLAQVSALGCTALSIVFMLLYYSNGENLEVLAYLFWPGLLILGAAHREASRRLVATEIGATDQPATEERSYA